ncbi:L,D-transpeptidase family protein [Cellulomonas biazotea]|uniref:L,D-transpeptidase family protein n=1 Tax=Cellulomonas biazotea TaxID=1709 RepID=UPI0035E670A3
MPSPARSRRRRGRRRTGAPGDAVSAARRSGPLASAALVVAALVVVAGCAPVTDPPVVAPVVVALPVAVEKVAAPPPPAPVDLTTLPVVDVLHVVPGLPGTDGLSPLENSDTALGRWRTVTVTEPAAAYATVGGPAVGVVPTTVLGAPHVLPVVDEASGWVRVLVATRGALPSEDRAQVNGRTAWIRTSATQPSGTDWSVVVDVAAQTLTVDDGTSVRTFPVLATGAPDTPTPHGLAFLLGLRWEEPGTTTPRVLPLSTQSETIDHYDVPTGTAVTAIHTTTLRGRGPVSNGCVRVTDDVVDVLWQAPAGTVVTTVG